MSWNPCVGFFLSFNTRTGPAAEQMKDLAVGVLPVLEDNDITVWCHYSLCWRMMTSQCDVITPCAGGWWHHSVPKCWACCCCSGRKDWPSRPSWPANCFCSHLLTDLCFRHQVPKRSQVHILKLFRRFSWNLSDLSVKVRSLKNKLFQWIHKFWIWSCHFLKVLFCQVKAMTYALCIILIL